MRQLAVEIVADGKTAAEMIIAVLALGALQRVRKRFRATGRQHVPGKASSITGAEAVLPRRYGMNEMAFQYVIPALQATTQPGGVFLGVGPDQNFTYIVGIETEARVHLRHPARQSPGAPAVQSRRSSMSDDARRFPVAPASRGRVPAGSIARSSADAMLDAYAHRAGEATRCIRKICRTCANWLTKHHGFALGDSTSRASNTCTPRSIVGGARSHLQLRQCSAAGSAAATAAACRPTGELMVLDRRRWRASQLHRERSELPRARDPPSSTMRSFRSWETLRATRRSRRSLQYLKDRQATVTAFYLSNVEQYLWNGSDDGRKFFGNVATLPLDSASTFIRAVFNSGAAGSSAAWHARPDDSRVDDGSAEGVQGRAASTSYYDAIQAVAVSSVSR